MSVMRNLCDDLSDFDTALSDLAASVRRAQTARHTHVNFGLVRETTTALRQATAQLDTLSRDREPEPTPAPAPHTTNGHAVPNRQRPAKAHA